VRLAKPHLDIGLFTNDIGAHREFWARTVGVRLDHELAMGPGWVQHRFDANGSVVKVNHRSADLPDRPPSGYVGLSIARAAQSQHWGGTDPDGDRVELVAHGLRMAGVAARGGRIVRPAVNFSGVARYGFVADPDGNWVEISARTSLTGVTV
jgi:lactoylglutathione lyase